MFSTSDYVHGISLRIVRCCLDVRKRSFIVPHLSPPNTRNRLCLSRFLCSSASKAMVGELLILAISVSLP